MVRTIQNAYNNWKMGVIVMIKQHTLLAIDTSTATMAGAIVQAGRTLTEVQTEAERNHSIHIMTNIEAMLHEAGLKVDDITAFVTGIGPGSYTGVRIAVTAAKTLAWTSNKSVVGISSLEGLAYGAVIKEQPLYKAGKVLVAPIMDARRGQVYTAAFAYNEQHSWERIVNDQIVLMDQWCKQLEADIKGNVHANVTELWFVGDVQLHEASIAYLEQAIGDKAITVRRLEHAMQGEAIARLGEMKLATMSEEALSDPHELVPNYAQLTEAEVKQNAKEKEEG